MPVLHGKAIPYVPQEAWVTFWNPIWSFRNGCGRVTELCPRLLAAACSAPSWNQSLASSRCCASDTDVGCLQHQKLLSPFICHHWDFGRLLLSNQSSSHSVWRALGAGGAGSREAGVWKRSDFSTSPLITGLWRYNSYTTQFTHLKDIIEWGFLVYSQSCLYVILKTTKS